MELDFGARAFNADSFFGSLRGDDVGAHDAVLAGAVKVAVGLLDVDQFGLSLKGVEHPHAALVGQAQTGSDDRNASSFCLAGGALFGVDLCGFALRWRRWCPDWLLSLRPACAGGSISPWQASR